MSGMRLHADEGSAASEEGEVGWQNRDYQYKAHECVFAQFAKDQSTLLVMPTGTGKTFVAAQIASTAKSRGWKTLFLAHRELLINQAAATLADVGLNVAIEMANQDAQVRLLGLERPDVVVGTVQTMQGDRLASWSPDEFQLIITDECHRAAAPSHQAIYRHFSRAKHLGITATPDGSSGRIGDTFKTLAYEYRLDEAVKDGWLIPPYPVERCKIPIDLRGLKATNGDYNGTDIAERIGPSILYIADGIRQRVESRYCVVFTPDVASAQGVAASLERIGSTARYVAGTAGRFGQSKGERAARIAGFNRREFQIVVCCDLLFEGWDAPHVSAVVIARPTLLRYRYVQMIGRGTRLCEGKKDLLIVDFDWKTEQGSRELMTVVDIWAAEDPELKEFSAPIRAKVLEQAKAMMDQGATDPRKVLDECIKVARERMTLPVAGAPVKAEFEVEVLDPLGVAKLLNISFNKRCDYKSPVWAEAKPWQVSKLSAYGVRDAGRLSFIGAQKLLRHLEQRKAAHMASHPQVLELCRLGIEPNWARGLTAAQAHATLSDLKGNK